MIARLLVLLFPAFAVAAPTPVTLIEKLGSGRNVRAEYSPAAAGKPTFLFLPGANRGLLLSEPAAQKLIENGNGVVSFDFSVQPRSIATLNAGEVPFSNAQTLTLDALARETEAIAGVIANRFGVRSVLPVSLSYSGAVSRHLRADRTIDCVPLTSTDAFSPELASYRRWLRAAEVWNPFFGPSITRLSLDTAYRTQWTRQVARLTEQFDLPRGRSADMVTGYTRLSQAAEDFTWTSEGDRTKRTFVLAGDESPSLFRHQLATVRDRLRSGSGESVFIVQESSHVVPADQPVIYARLLELIESGAAPQGLTVITPTRGEWRTLPGAQAVAGLEEILARLPAGSEEHRSEPPRSEVPGTL